jgi:hypothetical protein
MSRIRSMGGSTTCLNSTVLPGSTGEMESTLSVSNAALCVNASRRGYITDQQ